MIHIHVDVDNLWVYEQEYGITIHKNKEYIYTQSLPVFLRLLKRSRSKATFMIIGKDLELPACRLFCKKAIAEGHEIANHTWDHLVSFGSVSYEEKKHQILKAHKKIAEVCGKKPVGFRGPGYYQDEEIVTILRKLCYTYDTSVLPGFAQLLMSMYARVRGGENKDKSFGRSAYIFSPEQQHVICGIKPNEILPELPISVLPFLRLPIHTTFAYVFGEKYQELILRYLKSKPTYIVYVFHAIDFIDLPQQDSNHPVVPLRYSFTYRMSFAEKIIQALVLANGGPLKTSRDTLMHAKLAL